MTTLKHANLWHRVDFYMLRITLNDNWLSKHIFSAQNTISRLKQLRVPLERCVLLLKNSALSHKPSPSSLVYNRYIFLSNSPSITQINTHFFYLFVPFFFPPVLSAEGDPWAGTCPPFRRNRYKCWPFGVDVKCMK